MQTTKQNLELYFIKLCESLEIEIKALNWLLTYWILFTIFSQYYYVMQRIFTFFMSKYNNN